jgi:hypothetical protein
MGSINISLLQEIFREFTCGIDVQIYLPAMSFMGGI